MRNYTEVEIKKLQDNLSTIRKAGGWSAEEFGDMIGVTKQTIRNLENGKTAMSKIQYIAIRAVLDYEVAERPDDKSFVSAVNLYLNSEKLSEADKKKAQAFVEGATKTGLDGAAIFAGLTALIGATAAEAATMVAPVAIDVAGVWLERIIKGKK